MSNKALSKKCAFYNFEALFKKKGYKWFSKKDYNLNIIGVRSKAKIRCTNLFDDFIIVDYYCNNVHHRKLYEATTTPGLYYLENPMNTKGTAIMVPGQHLNCYTIGKHKNKYKALVQTKAIKVYRDNNKDDIYDMLPDTIEETLSGLNIHRTNEYFKSKQIDKWSAGCQVFASPSDFKSFMTLCEKQAELYSNSFTYTLIEEQDLI